MQQTLHAIISVYVDLYSSGKVSVCIIHAMPLFITTCLSVHQLIISNDAQARHLTQEGMQQLQI